MTTTKTETDQIAATKTETDQFAAAGQDAATSTTMPTTESTLTALDLDQLVREINDEHHDAQQAARDGVEHARRCGELLLHVKDKLMHGAFMPWVEQHCEFSHRTATMYMRIASEWDRITADWQSVANMGITALYTWLTGAATPDEPGPAEATDEEAPAEEELPELSPSAKIGELLSVMAKGARWMIDFAERLEELGHGVADVAQTAALLQQQIRAAQDAWLAVAHPPRPAERDFTPASTTVLRDRLVEHLRRIACPGTLWQRVEQVIFGPGFAVKAMTADQLLLVLAPALPGTDLGAEIGVPDLGVLIRALNAACSITVTVRLEGQRLLVDNGSRGVLRLLTCAPRLIVTRVEDALVEKRLAQVDGLGAPVVLPAAWRRDVCATYARLKAGMIALTVGPDGATLRVGDTDSQSAEFALPALQRPAEVSLEFGGHFVVALRALRECRAPVTVRVGSSADDLLVVAAEGYQYVMGPRTWRRGTGRGEQQPTTRLCTDDQNSSSDHPECSAG